MSPILVRPVREQLEHDRIIRLLQIKLKRKHDVTANIGEDQSTSVKIGQMQIFPDLLLTSTDRGRRLMGTVEVETSESVNHLEARAQWAHLGHARAPFHLYVPASSVDIARRLAVENHVNVSEIWSYHTIGDQTHFKLVQRSAAADGREARAERAAIAKARIAAGGESPAPKPRAPEKADKEKQARVAPRVAKKRAPAAPGRRSTARARSAAPARKSASASQKRK